MSMLRAHVRNVRTDIEKRGILIDEDINVALRKMLFAGRKAIEDGIEPKDSKEYLKAATNVHKVVREKEKAPEEGALPMLSYKRFPRQKRKVQSLNMKMKKMKRSKKGLKKLIHLANNKAKSESEFEYFLREIGFLLR